MRVFRRGKTWWVDYLDPYGRRVRESSGTGSKTEAEAILASLMTKVREGKFFDIVRPSKHKFMELMELVHDHEKKIGRRSYKTFFLTYSRGLEAHFGGKFLSEISPKMIKEYQFMKAKTVCGATVNRSLATLRKVFNLAIKWGMTKTNPVNQIEFFDEPQGRVRFLEQQEQEDLLDCCKGYLRDVVTVALRTGMRSGELRGLHKKDVDFKRGFIYLGKTKSGVHRQIPMVPNVRAVLTKLAFGIGDDEILFRNRLGKPYCSFRNAFETALKVAGIKDFRFHDLRHTFASDFMMAGNDIFTLSKILGHANVETTMIYAHLSPTHHKAEMAKFEAYILERGTNLAQTIEDSASKEVAVK